MTSHVFLTASSEVNRLKLPLQPSNFQFTVLNVVVAIASETVLERWCTVSAHLHGGEHPHYKGVLIINWFNIDKMHFFVADTQWAFDKA